MEAIPVCKIRRKCTFACAYVSAWTEIVVGGATWCECLLFIHYIPNFFRVWEYGNLHVTLNN